MGTFVPSEMPEFNLPPTFVQQAVNTAENTINRATEVLGSIRDSGNEFSSQIDKLVAQVSAVKIPELPTLKTFEPGTLPKIDAFQAKDPQRSLAPNLLPINDGTSSVPVPVNKATRPNVVYQEIDPVPVMEQVAMPQLDNTGALPGMPVLEDVPLPVLRELTIPALPNVTLPTFSTTRPGAPAVAVDDMVLHYEPADYLSPWLDRLQAQVVDALANGTGLSAANEDAIFGRARDRALTEQRAAEQAAMTSFASRGFALPSGPLLAMIENARAKGQAQVAEVSREAAIKRAEWEIQNWQFVMGKMQELEGLSQQFYLGHERLLLESAQAVIQSKVQTYNVLATIYQASIDAYKADVTVFSTLIDAELQKIKAYEVQLEGVKALGEVNMQEVQIFSERKKALQISVDIYKAQVDAVVALEGRNMRKVELFRAQSEAQASYVQALAARAQAIGTSNQAKAAVIQGYQADISAYGAEVQAYSARIEAAATQAKITGEVNNNLLQKYTAEIQGDQTYYQAIIANEQAKAARYNVEVEAWKAQADINARVAEVANNNATTSVNYALRTAEILSKAAESAANATISRAKLAQDKAISVGQVYANMAASAFGAVQASYSSRVSNDYGQQLNETHNYYHRPKEG